MAKTKEEGGNVENPGADQRSVTKASEGNSPSRRTQKYDLLAATQCARTAPWQYVENEGVNETLSKASLDLYEGLEPQNASEAALSMLTAALTSASLDCFSQAARASIGRYLDFYNGRRPHSSLDETTPDQAYFTPLPIRMAA